MLQQLHLTRDNLVLYDYVMNTTNHAIPLKADKFYKTNEVANILRLSPAIVRRLMREGLIKTNRNSKPYMVWGAHIYEFIENQFVARPTHE